MWCELLLELFQLQKKSNKKQINVIESLLYYKVFPGADPGFQVRGAHLNNLCRSEVGAKIVGVFRVKNHDFTPKKDTRIEYDSLLNVQLVKYKWIIFIKKIYNILRHRQRFRKQNIFRKSNLCLKMLPSLVWPSRPISDNIFHFFSVTIIYMAAIT